jgi:hypothetical protein
MEDDLKELQSAANAAGLEMEFLELLNKAKHAKQMLDALDQIDDWCCYAVDKDTATRLMALQQIGVHAREAISMLHQTQEPAQ